MLKSIETTIYAEKQVANKSMKKRQTSFSNQENRDIS